MFVSLYRRTSTSRVRGGSLCLSNLVVELYRVVEPVSLSRVKGESLSLSLGCSPASALLRQAYRARGDGLRAAKLTGPARAAPGRAADTRQARAAHAQRGKGGGGRACMAKNLDTMNLRKAVTGFLGRAAPCACGRGQADDSEYHKTALCA